MSGHPYSQGQWSASQPDVPYSGGVPFVPHDYSQQNSAAHPMPYGGYTYQTTPQAPQPAAPQFPASTVYYAATEATRVAFEHNANTYATGESSSAEHGAASVSAQSPAPGPRSPGAVGGGLSWSQAFPTRHTAASSSYASYSQPPAQQFSTDPAVYQKQDQQQQPALQRVVYSPPAYLTSGLSAPPAAQPVDVAVGRSRNSDLEEGELNEEDMDDDYDPEDISMPRDEQSGKSKQQSLDFSGAALKQAAALGSPPSRDASVVDTQEDEFYDEEDEEPGEVKSTGKGALPSEAGDADDEDMGFSDISEIGSTPALRHHTETVGNAQSHVSDAAVPVANGHAVAITKDNSNNSGSPNGQASAGNLVLSETTNANSPRTPPFATVEEGKKEAQRAILRLLPYGVSFQTYIDEGFDEKVIKALFAELGLKTAPANPAAQVEASKPPSPKITTVDAIPASAGVADSESGPKKEERKDRIARLLALKNTLKPSSAPAPPAANTQTHLAASASPQAHPEKTKSEKEKLLQQKLGELKKAQELRAAAAAKAKEQAAALGKTIANEHASTLDPSAATKTSQAEQNLATKGQQFDRAVPAATISNCKRPVAADFADFAATPANPPKRHFSMTRQESSLVIDISDESDNDVEMELESQTDETPVKKVAENSPAYGRPSFQDRPPLPDNRFPPRQQGHATMSFRAPPTGPARSSNKAKDDEYTKKLRQIEEMKRKIAKAEALKARSTGSLTPKAAVSSSPGSSDAARREAQGVRSSSQTAGVANGAERGTREDGTSLKQRQPRASEASDVVSSRSSSRASHHEQRARIASQQLPRVEASLQEKMFKLKLFQEKVAVLEAEINAGMAEKQRLKEEMDALIGSGDKKARAQTETTSSQEPTTQAKTDAQAEAEAPARADTQMGTDAQAPADVDHSRDLTAGGQPPVSNDAETASVAEAPAQLDYGDKEPITIAESSAGSSAELAAGNQSAADPKLDAQSVPESESESESESEFESGSVRMSDVPSPQQPTADNLDGDGDVIMEDDAEPDEDVAEQQELLKPPSAAAVHEDANGSQASVHGTTTTAPTVSTFVPYESPLKNFSSYRFHPKYKEQIKGGLKSLTFSGRIQDDVVLCPYELEGQECPDPACGFQHFALMLPRDDQILVELGRSDEFSGEQKALFVNGLKDLLKRVRDANVRDFDTIADEVIRFRREFLGDDSKVVSHLGDITI